MTTEAKQAHSSRISLLHAPIKLKSVEQILDEVDFKNIPQSHRKSFLNVITTHSDVFQPDLPGYNNAYGPVYANFEFASKARSTPQKLRAPAYGSHVSKTS